MDESLDKNSLIPYDKLVELAQVGDKRAFTDLFNHYLPQIAGYVAGMGPPLDDRDDLLQEIFLKAWKDLPTLRQTCNFKSWLYRIATNAVYDYWRGQKSPRRVGLISLSECLENDEAPDPTQSFFDEYIGENELVGQALKEVPATYRICLILEIQGVSREEIAEIVGISPASVGTYISMARRFFRQAYHRLNQQPGEETRSAS